MSIPALSHGLVDGAVPLHTDLSILLADAVVGVTTAVILFALYYRFVLQRASR